MTVNLFYGTVASLQDPDLKGKIQVRVLPELADAPAADLPWLAAFSTLSSTSQAKQHQPPAVNSPVWAIFLDSSLQVGFYLNGIQAEDNFNFSQVTQALGGVSGLSTQQLSQIRFTQYEDGSVAFQNSTTKEYGFLHTSGSFVAVFSDGSIKAYSKGSITLSNANGSFLLSATGALTMTTSQGQQLISPSLEWGTSNGTVDYLVTFTKLQSILTDLIGWINALVLIDPLSGATGSPLPAMLSTVLFPTLQTIDIPGMKSG